MREYQIGDRNWQWKGDKVGYTATHDWIRTHYGSANRCDNPDCKGFSVVYEWANLSGKYHRDRSDFMMMCRSCHRIYDKRMPFCINGHEFTEANTRMTPDGRKRCCRACAREYYHKARARLRGKEWQ